MAAKIDSSGQNSTFVTIILTSEAIVTDEDKDPRNMSVSFVRISNAEPQMCIICLDPETHPAEIWHDGHDAMHEKCLRGWIQSHHIEVLSDLNHDTRRCPGCRQLIDRVDNASVGVFATEGLCQ
jgi:hypothetical protein